MKFHKLEDAEKAAERIHKRLATHSCPECGISLHGCSDAKVTAHIYRHAVENCNSLLRTCAAVLITAERDLRPLYPLAADDVKDFLDGYLRGEAPKLQTRKV